MTAYALAHVHAVEFCDDIAEYLRRIDDTLDPFGGRFLVHGGGRPEVLEGGWDEGLIIIGFPDLDSARAWYRSPAYQEILPLRTRHMAADIILAGGVPDGYRATRTEARLSAR